MSHSRHPLPSPSRERSAPSAVLRHPARPAPGLAGVFDRIRDRVLLYFELEERARRQAEELLGLPTDRARRAAVRAAPDRFRNPALVAELLARARELSGEPPRPVDAADRLLSRELAELALEVAVSLEDEPFGRRFRLDRVAETRLYLAEEWRRLGWLARARQYLVAAENAAEGTSDPMLRAEVGSVVAAVREAESWERRGERSVRAAPRPRPALGVASSAYRGGCPLP